MAATARVYMPRLAPKSENIQIKLNNFFKGTVPQEFRLQVFIWISFPQAPDYTIRVVYNFFQKFVEIFAAQGAPPVSLTPAANEKILQSENFFYFFFINLEICSFKFTLRCQQSDIVPIMFAGVIDTGGKFATGLVDTA
jgi:hypothetical protein